MWWWSQLKEGELQGGRGAGQLKQRVFKCVCVGGGADSAQGRCALMGRGGNGASRRKVWLNGSGQRDELLWLPKQGDGVEHA
eukprot:363326-Chlamydomonas_euryale.AAC.3